MTSTGSTSQQLILQAMISIASADGEIDADEMTTLRRLYLKETGEEVSVSDVTKAARMLQANAASLSTALSAASPAMDRATKESLLRACYLVLLADGRVAARERKKLQDFAGALKIPEIHLSVILEDVSLDD